MIFCRGIGFGETPHPLMRGGGDLHYIGKMACSTRIQYVYKVSLSAIHGNK
jgi:hypothetical protein